MAGLEPLVGPRPLHLALRPRSMGSQDFPPPRHGRQTYRRHHPDRHLRPIPVHAQPDVPQPDCYVFRRYAVVPLAAGPGLVASRFLGASLRSHFARGKILGIEVRRGLHRIQTTSATLVVIRSAPAAVRRQPARFCRSPERSRMESRRTVRVPRLYLPVLSGRQSRGLSKMLISSGRFLRQAELDHAPALIPLTPPFVLAKVFRDVKLNHLCHNRSPLGPQLDPSKF